MEWHLMLLLIFGSLIITMVSGMPVAFCFLLVNIIFMFLLWGGGVGIEQFILSMFDSLASFTLLPVALFILMGDVMFHSGIAVNMIDTLDKWLGRLSGRLGLLAVGGGTLLAALTGTSLASVAILGTVLVPEMEQRGYKKEMSIGPILGSGCLAMMIPPSAMGVLFGAIAEISIGRILIAIIVPGLMMAALYAVYIIMRCRLQPSIAPAYQVRHVPLSEKLIDTARYVLPLGIIIFLVVGVIFMGIATPSEAAATGTMGCFILAAAYKKLTWEGTKKALSGTLHVTVMIFFLIAGAKAFSQIMAFSGASHGLVQFVLGLPIGPIPIFIGMIAVGIFLGMFMNISAVMMITLPLYIPVVHALNFDPIWFAVIMLIILDMGSITPPFGLALFVMKGISPADTTIGDCYRASLPFIALDLIAVAFIIVFPIIALWLPGLAR